MVHVRVEAGVICLLYGTHTHNTYTPPWQRVNTPWQASCCSCSCSWRSCDACAGIKSDCLLHKSLLNAALDIATPTDETHTSKKGWQPKKKQRKKREKTSSKRALPLTTDMKYLYSRHIFKHAAKDIGMWGKGCGQHRPLFIYTYTMPYMFKQLTQNSTHAPGCLSLSLSISLQPFSALPIFNHKENSKTNIHERFFFSSYFFAPLVILYFHTFIALFMCRGCFCVA